MKNKKELWNNTKTILQIFNSISCFTVGMCAFIFFSFIGVIIVVNIIINSQSQTISANLALKRSSQFGSISTKISELISSVEQGVIQMDGLCSVLGPLVMRRYETDQNGRSMNERRAIKLGYTFLNQFQKQIPDVKSFSFGHFLFERVNGTLNNIHSLIIENSILKIGNSTNNAVAYDAVNVQTDSNGLVPDEGSSIDFYSFRNDSSVFAMNPTESEIYARPLIWWEYWLGTQNAQLTPWFAFTITSRIDHALEITGGWNNNVSCNTWCGIDVKVFSSILKEYTPQDSFTWMIDLNSGYLLGFSEFSSIDEFYNAETKNFILAAESKHSEVAKITKKLQSDHSIMSSSLIHHSGRIETYTIDGYDIQALFLNSTYDGRWVLINAKLLTQVHGSRIFTLIFSSVLSFVYLLLILFFWIFICISVFIQVKKTFSNLKRIENMELDSVVVFKNPFIFYELKYLNKHLYHMSQRLRNFKNFLPSHLFIDQEHLISDANSTTYSNSSADSNGGSATVSDSSQRTGNSSIHGDDGMFKLGLVSKTVSCMVIKFREIFNLQQFFEKTFRTIERFEGHILEFSDTSIKVIFHNNVGKFLGLIKSLNKFNINQNISFIVGTGEVQAGNIGSSTKKQYIVTGELMDKMICLEQEIPNNVKINTIICEETHYYVHSLKEEYETRMIENVSHTLKNKYPQTKIKIYELGREKVIEQEEWMYQVAAKFSFERWKNYNLAIYFFEKKKFKEAKEAIKEYLITEECDKMGIYWEKKITQNLKTKSNSFLS